MESPYTIDVFIDIDLPGFADEALKNECPWVLDEQKTIERLSKLVEFILSQEKVRSGAEVSVTLATPEYIHELNRENRGVDSSTDVLSFPCDSPDDTDDEIILLGDIVIAPSIVYKQSREYGTTYTEELDLLITHGTLHLLGYDHIEDSDAEIMQAKERQLRGMWESR